MWCDSDGWFSPIVGSTMEIRPKNDVWKSSKYGYSGEGRQKILVDTHS